MPVWNQTIEDSVVSQLTKEQRAALQKEQEVKLQWFRDKNAGKEVGAFPKGEETERLMAKLQSECPKNTDEYIKEIRKIKEKYGKQPDKQEA